VIERLARSFPELEQRSSQFTGGPALWLGGREVVHAHGDELEIRITRREASRRDHDGFWQRTRGSDWVGLDAANEELAFELVRVAIDANRR
jgi:Luciferase